jgi:hypothetical protein
MEAIKANLLSHQVGYATSKPATTSEALPLIDLCIVVTVGDERLGRGVG